MKLPSAPCSTHDPCGSLGGAFAAGDLGGDGRADLALGHDSHDGGETNAGGVYVVLGNGRSGRGGNAVATPIGDPGRSLRPWAETEGGLVVSLAATSPRSRGRAKLEVEWCPAGTAFGDPASGSLTSSEWIDLGASSDGVVLSETIATSSPPGLQRRRAGVLHAPLGVTQPGIVPPPNRAHGPWVRPTAMAREADVRVPEPVVAASLVAGPAALAVVGRARASRRLKAPTPSRVPVGSARARRVAAIQSAMIRARSARPDDRIQPRTSASMAARSLRMLREIASRQGADSAPTTEATRSE